VASIFLTRCPSVLPRPSFSVGASLAICPGTFEVTFGSAWESLSRMTRLLTREVLVGGQVVGVWIGALVVVVTREGLVGVRGLVHSAGNYRGW
jgi:hypothetical protein